MCAMDPQILLWRLGKHGCRLMNENDVKLLKNCKNINLVVEGTLFLHQDIHKLTWY